MKIATYNPEVDNLEKSFLSTNVSSGATQLTIQNADRFTVGAKLLVGHMGFEGSEIITLSSVSSDNQTLATSATKYPHSIDDPVYVLTFDQVKIYRSVNGENGDYQWLATVDLDVDNDSLSTVYDDTTGLATYFYKSALYDSVLARESVLSPAVPGSGFAAGQVGELIDEMIEDVGDQSLSRKLILAWLNECNDDLSARAGKMKKPFACLHTRKTLSTIADNETVAFPDEMLMFDRFEYLYNPDSTIDEDYQPELVPYDKFRIISQNNLDSASDELKFICLDESVNKFRLYPRPATSQAGVIYLGFWKKFDKITSEDQNFETPTVRVYKMFLFEKHYRRLSRTNNDLRLTADDYRLRYEQEVVNLPRSGNISKRQPTGIRPPREMGKRFN